MRWEVEDNNHEGHEGTIKMELKAEGAMEREGVLETKVEGVI